VTLRGGTLRKSLHWTHTRAHWRTRGDRWPVSVVSTKVSGLLRIVTEVAVFATFIVWRSAAQPWLAVPPCGMEHPADHHDAPQHHTSPLDSCNCCNVCKCVSPHLLLSPRVAHAMRSAADFAAPRVDRGNVVVLAAPHRLPPSVGPPARFA
jgi:hypothetical protein